MNLSMIITLLCIFIFQSTTFAVSLPCQWTDSERQLNHQEISLEPNSEADYFFNALKENVGYIVKKEVSNKIKITFSHPSFHKSILPEIVFDGSNKFQADLKLERDAFLSSSYLSCADNTERAPASIVKPIVCKLFSSEGTLYGSLELKETINFFFGAELGKFYRGGFKTTLINPDTLKVMVISPELSWEHMPILYLNPTKPFDVSIKTSVRMGYDDLRLECTNL